jgi:hypothetical protein
MIVRKGLSRRMRPASIPWATYLSLEVQIADRKLEQQRLQHVRVQACHPDPWEVALHGRPHFRFRRAPEALRLRWRCA